MAAATRAQVRHPGFIEDDVMDITGLLNGLIANMLPALNKTLSTRIVNAGLDPWPNVDAGSKTLGEIHFHHVDASVTASYAITDMVGLSSMVMTALTVETVDSSKLPTVSGTLDFAATVNAPLSAKVSGEVEAKVEPFHESQGISGTVTATGVTGTGVMDFTATLSFPQSCFTQLTLTTLTLDYADITVRIDDLGVFNDFIKPLTDVINDLFGNDIKTKISDALPPVLNDAIAANLPFCVSDSGGEAE
jgi:hypothetical protein